MDEDFNRIVERSQEFLDTINEVFAQNGINLPARQYKTIGPLEETTHDFSDDGQLTVSFGSLRLGVLPSSQALVRNCTANYIGTFFIELVRCTPQTDNSGTSKYGTTTKFSSGPSKEEMDTYGEQRMRDTWLLLRAAQRMQETYGTLHDLVYNIVSGKEDGGVQAVRLSVDVLV